jgi:hypothetical protein
MTRADVLNTAFAGAVALFTLALVIVGAWQARRLRQTVDETRKAAKAAEKAAEVAEKALVDLERPILQIIDPFVGIDAPLSETNHGISAHYSIENFGRTPATLHEISLQFGTIVEPLNPPNYTVKIPIMTFIAQGKRVRMEAHPLPESGSFVFGYLKYTDIFGFVHVAGFGLKRQNKIWIVTGGTHQTPAFGSTMPLAAARTSPA